MAGTNMKIWRMENAQGQGPFQVMQDWSEFDVDRYARGFAESAGWPHLIGGDIFSRMLAEPPQLGELAGAIMGDYTHPHHDNDVPKPPLHDHHKWRVGCRNKQQFEHWFPPKSFVFFKGYGFELVVYECQRKYVLFGKYQLLFCVDSSQIKERKCLASL